MKANKNGKRKGKSKGILVGTYVTREFHARLRRIARAERRPLAYITLRALEEVAARGHIGPGGAVLPADAG